MIFEATRLGEVLAHWECITSDQTGVSQTGRRKRASSDEETEWGGKQDDRRSGRAEEGGAGPLTVFSWSYVDVIPSDGQVELPAER